jgi:hypothetical protein
MTTRRLLSEARRLAGRLGIDRAGAERERERREQQEEERYLSYATLEELRWLVHVYFPAAAQATDPDSMPPEYRAEYEALCDRLDERMKANPDDRAPPAE